MKTKKLFMLLAVVLLSSASAFAQESETLKGDVNEDGVVDVADINAVIEIMKAGGGTVEPTTYYFSIGTTPVTADNYTTANDATTIIPTTIEYTSSQRTYHYILIPDDKTLTITDKVSQLSIPVTEQTSISIPNHKLYKTNGAIGATATVVITLTPSEPQPTTYYFYVGTTKPTSLSEATVVSEYPAELTYTNNSGAKSHIFVLTNDDKNVTFINIATGNPVTQNEVDTVTIPGCKIFETSVGTANTGSIKIRIS